jgi:hypothetical protein
MSKPFLDFKNFKKVADDDSIATFEHSDGHKIQVVKKGLSGPLKKQLSELPLHQADPTGPVEDTAPDQDTGDFTPSSGAASGATLGAEQGAPDTSQPEVLGQVAPQHDPNAVPSDPNEPFAQGTNALNLKQAADEDKAKRDTATYQGAVDSHQDALDDLNDISDAHTQEVHGAVQDMKNNFIKPNDYLDHMSTGKKISTAIGLFLGGIGSAKTGQPNPAMQFLQSQIERNIEAQRANQGTRGTLLSALQNKYKDDLVATNMAKVIMASKVADEMNESAAKSGLPMAKVNNLMGQQQFARDYMPLKRQMDAYQFFRSSNAGPASKLTAGQMAGIINPEQYKEGIKELGVAEKTQEAHKAVDEILPSIEQQQTLGNRIGSPIQSSQKIAALKARLVPLILSSSPSKRLTREAVEQEIAPYIPKFTTGKGTAKDLASDLHRSVDSLADKTPVLDGLGIQTPKYAPPAPTKTVNGVTYKRGPNGEAIRVK